jgi:hypothetical protein
MNSWRKIPGFARYEVSKFGVVRVALDAPKKPKQRLAPGQTVTLRKMKFGYLRCELLGDNGRPSTMTSHHAIALAFKGPRPSPLHCALHKDDNPTNNNVKNIKWGTKGDNAKDRIRNGNNLKGAEIGTAKLTDEKVREIKRRYQQRREKLKTIGADFGVSLHTVHLIVRGKTWRHVI